MSNYTSVKRPPRVLFFGMQSDFSSPSLRALLENGIEVQAIVIPASHVPGREGQAIRPHEELRTAHAMLPLFNSALRISTLQLARERQIPVWEVQRLADGETCSVLGAYRPDLICVACFSRRIPRTILEIPRLGCLNVHPSLLPANRGPVPLFWTFREGESRTGVTVHLMDESMDTGDIVSQKAIEVPDGIGYAHLEVQCAIRGGELLARAVQDMCKGRITRAPQDEAKSSYHPFPSAEDFVVPAAEWSARHAYNFICGVAGWGGPVTIELDNERFVARDAIAYSHNAEKGDAEVRLRRVKEGIWVRCRDGWVLVEV